MYTGASGRCFSSDPRVLNPSPRKPFPRKINPSPPIPPALLGALETAIDSALDAVCHPAATTAASAAQGLAAVMQVRDTLAAHPAEDSAPPARAASEGGFSWRCVLAQGGSQLLRSLGAMAVMLLILWNQVRGTRDGQAALALTAPGAVKGCHSQCW